MYSRTIVTSIIEHLTKKEVILLYGARQTEKSTLLKILSEKLESFRILNCEHPAVYDILTEKNLSKIEMLFDKKEVVAFDEAQTIPEVGKILKLLYDEEKLNYKFIATGSSSFELSNRTGEPLTGRNTSFILYPLSLNEISEHNGWLNTIEKLNELLVFGAYPGVIDLSAKEKREKLLSLSNDYLFKDIFKFEQLRNAEVLRKILKALALQLGNLISFQELATLTGVSRQTVERYLDLLEKSFIVFRLRSFSGNLRNELRKRHKYYFYDAGIKNAVINNFSDVNSRVDTGALWENFCINEIIKKDRYRQVNSNFYFWHTYDGAELDLIKEVDGKVVANEFKWSPKRKPKLPAAFSKKYNVTDYIVLSPANIHLMK